MVGGSRGETYEERCVGEEIVHFLQGLACRFGEEQVEEEGVGEVADDEEEVVAVADVGHGRVGDLADDGVEGEGDHGGDGDAFGARARVEDLGRDDPGEGAAGGGEGEVVEPGHDDEAPRGADVVVGRRWEFGNKDARDEECELR